MIRTEFVPCRRWHAEAIAANPREADVDELWISSRTRPLDALLHGMQRSTAPLTAMHDGEPVAMLGVVPFSILSGMGVVWMLGSEKLDRLSCQRDLLRTSRPQVALWREQFPSLLFNYVDQRNHQAIRWLKWLGFTFLPPVPYGPDGALFIPFMMGTSVSKYVPSGG